MKKTSAKTVPSTPSPEATPQSSTTTQPPNILKRITTRVSKVYTYLSESVRKKPVSATSDNTKSVFSLKKMILVLSGIAACFTAYYYWNKISFGNRTEPIVVEKQHQGPNSLVQVAKMQVLENQFLELAKELDNGKAKIQVLEKELESERTSRLELRKEVSGKLAVISHTMVEQQRATNELKSALKEFEVSIRSLTQTTTQALGALEKKNGSYIELPREKITADVKTSPVVTTPPRSSDLHPTSPPQEPPAYSNRRGTWTGYYLEAHKESRRYHRSDLLQYRVTWEAHARVEVLGKINDGWRIVEPPFDWRTLNGIEYIKIIPRERTIAIYELTQPSKYEL